MHFFIRDSFFSEAEARLSILDLGLIRGYAIFDYLRTYQRKPFHLQDHLQRLQFGAKGLGLELPYSLETMTSIISELIDRNEAKELSLKLFITGGESPDQLLPTGIGSFIAFSYPLKSPPPEYALQGIKVTTTPHQRTLPSYKTANYLSAIVSLQEAKKAGAIESLYLNDKQQILEGTTSNFFAIKQGVLLTPPEDGILLGITRSVILKLCKKHFPIQITPIAYSDIATLDEAFITASNKEILPVTHIDNHPIANGKVGPITKQIMQMFSQYTQEQNWPDLAITRYRL